MDEKTQKPKWWLWALCALLVSALVAGLFSLANVRQSRRDEAINCASYIQSIVLAARMWAGDHGDRLPLDIISMSNELASPKVLHCPSDHTRQRISTWAQFAPADSSYLLASPGAGEGDSNTVVIRCTIHGHLGYFDGTVFDAVRRVRDRPRK